MKNIFGLQKNNNKIDGHKYVIRSLSEDLIKEILHNLKKERKNHEGNYITLDTSTEKTRAFTINPEYITDSSGKTILQGEGMIRLEFTNPIDYKSARIKGIVTVDGTTTRPDLTSHFTISDYDYDPSKNKPYYIIIRRHYRRLVLFVSALMRRIWMHSMQGL